MGEETELTKEDIQGLDDFMHSNNNSNTKINHNNIIIMVDIVAGIVDDVVGIKEMDTNPIITGHKTQICTGPDTLGWDHSTKLTTGVLL